MLVTKTKDPRLADLEPCHFTLDELTMDPSKDQMSTSLLQMHNILDGRPGPVDIGILLEDDDVRWR